MFIHEWGPEWLLKATGEDGGSRMLHIWPSWYDEMLSIGIYTTGFENFLDITCN